jgi:hypothetical protein
VGFDAATVGEQFARVLEHDDAVAEEAPPLFRVRRDDTGSLPVDGIGGRALGLVLAHRGSPGFIAGRIRGDVCVITHMTSDARYQGPRRVFEQETARTEDNPTFG